MHRIDAPGFAPGNLFTEGNPSLSIPATEVSDDWLNDVQEEVANVIEDAGITLVKGLQTQLRDAIQIMIGGSFGNIKLDPLANTTADQVITGLIFDKTVVKAAIMFIDVHKRTDTQNAQETMLVMATHDSEDDVWRVSKILTAFDDSLTTLNITSTGQVRATTTDFTGASYTGQLRVNGVLKLAL